MLKMVVESYLGAGKGNVTGKGVIISPSGSSSHKSSSSPSGQSLVTPAKVVSWDEFLKAKAEADARIAAHKAELAARGGVPVSAAERTQLALAQAYKYGVGVAQTQTPITIKDEGQKTTLTRKDVVRMQADYFAGQRSVPNPREYGQTQVQQPVLRDVVEATKRKPLNTPGDLGIANQLWANSFGQLLREQGQLQNANQLLSNWTINRNYNNNFGNFGNILFNLQTQQVDNQQTTQFIKGKSQDILIGLKDWAKEVSITLLKGTGKFFDIANWNPQLREGKTPLSWWKPYEQYNQKVGELEKKYLQTPNLLADTDVQAAATLPVYSIPYVGEGLLIYGGVKGGIEVIKKPSYYNIGKESLNILGGVFGAKLGYERVTWDVPSIIQKIRGQTILPERITEKRILENKQKFTYTPGQTPQQLKMAAYFNPYKITPAPSAIWHGSIKPLPRTGIALESQSESPGIYGAVSFSKRFAGLKGGIESPKKYVFTFWPKLPKPTATQFEVPVDVIPKKVPRTMEAMNKFLESPEARNKAWVSPAYMLGKQEAEFVIAPGSTFHRQWEQMIPVKKTITKTMTPSQALGYLEKQGLIKVNMKANLPKNVGGEFNPSDMSISIAKKVPQAQKEKVIAHEIVHYKQETTWPIFLLNINDKLPYRLQPAEIQAYALGKSLAEKGISMPVGEKIVAGTKKVGNWFDKLVGFQKVTTIEGKNVRIYQDVVGEGIKPKPGVELTPESAKTITQRKPWEEEIYTEYVSVPHIITSISSLSRKTQRNMEATYSELSSSKPSDLSIQTPISSKKAVSNSEIAPSISISPRYDYSVPYPDRYTPYPRSRPPSTPPSRPIRYTTSDSSISLPPSVPVSPQTISGSPSVSISPTIPKLLPPEIPKIHLPSGAKPSQTTRGGFFVIFREFGREVKATARPMTYKQAELFGRDITKQSLTASYKVVPTYMANLPQAARIKWASGEWVSPFRFTEGKTKATKGFKVELPKFRIGGLGAKVELKIAREKKKKGGWF